MLRVSIHLHRDLIPMVPGIPVAGLHRAADPKVNRKIHHMESLLQTDLQRTVLRAVIYHQIIIVRRLLQDPPHRKLDPLLFIEGRNDHKLFPPGRILRFLALLHSCDSIKQSRFR